MENTPGTTSERCPTENGEGHSTVSKRTSIYSHLEEIHDGEQGGSDLLRSNKRQKGLPDNADSEVLTQIEGKGRTDKSCYMTENVSDEDETADINMVLVENEDDKLTIGELVDTTKYKVLEDGRMDGEMCTDGCILSNKSIGVDKKTDVMEPPVIEGQCIHPVVEKRSDQLIEEKVVDDETTNNQTIEGKGEKTVAQLTTQEECRMSVQEMEQRKVGTTKLKVTTDNMARHLGEYSAPLLYEGIITSSMVPDQDGTITDITNDINQKCLPESVNHHNDSLDEMKQRSPQITPPVLTHCSEQLYNTQTADAGDLESSPPLPQSSYTLVLEKKDEIHQVQVPEQASQRQPVPKQNQGVIDTTSTTYESEGGGRLTKLDSGESSESITMTNISEPQLTRGGDSFDIYLPPLFEHYDVLLGSPVNVLDGCISSNFVQLLQQEPLSGTNDGVNLEEFEQPHHQSSSAEGVGLIEQSLLQAPPQDSSSLTSPVPLYILHGDIQPPSAEPDTLYLSTNSAKLVTLKDNTSPNISSASSSTAPQEMVNFSEYETLRTTGGGGGGVVEQCRDTPVAADNKQMMTSTASNSLQSSMANTPQDLPLLIPANAKWFNLSTISKFEERMLPEFFTGRSASKTPSYYLQTRNYMVYKFSSLRKYNPSARITATEVRHSLAGDVCALLRIHEFLQTFGIINYNPRGGKILDNEKRLALYAPIPQETWDNNRYSPAVTSESSDRKHYKSESPLGEGQEVTDKLLRLTVQHSFEWEKVAKDTGNWVSPMDCKQKFMSLSVEEMLAGADPGCNTGLLNSQQCGISSSLLSAAMGNANPLSTIPGPALCLLRGLVKDCRPEVLSAALSAAQEELSRLNDNEQRDNKQKLHRSAKVEDREGCIDGKDTTTDTSCSDVKVAGRAAALSVIAINGGTLVNAESLRIQELMADLADLRLKRLERRIKQLDALQSILDREAVQLEADRMELLTMQARVWMQANT